MVGLSVIVEIHLELYKKITTKQIVWGGDKHTDRPTHGHRDYYKESA